MDLISVVKHSPIVFALACVAALAMVFVSEGSYWQALSEIDDLGEKRVVRETIQGLERSILDAEAGQRGYLLTNRPEYLPPYNRALMNTGASFNSLEVYYASAPGPLALVGQLHSLTDAKLSELALTLRLHDERKSPAALEIILSNIGKEQMDAIRALSVQLLAYEASQSALSRADLNRTLLRGRIGMAALSVLSLLALLLFLRQSRMGETHQQELKRIVQAERDRLDIEVRDRTAQLTELTNHLQTAREDERARLARNLHDELGALLTSAKLDAARIKSRITGSAPDALERLAHLVATLNSSIALGRRIIEDLRPSTLGNLGLVATLDILLREFAERSGVQVHSELAPVKLGPSAELVVYRLVQEAVTNISKYAHARQVWVSLAEQGSSVQVVVRDDGVGFDPAARTTSVYGLVGMRFRIESVGGTLRLVSAPGQGTQLHVSLPKAPDGHTGPGRLAGPG